MTSDDALARAGWTDVTLGNCSEITPGFAFKSASFEDGPAGDRLLRGDNISPSRVRWDRTKFWRRESGDRLDSFELVAGDVVLAMDRPWIEAGLKVAIVQDADLPALLVQRVARLRGSAALDQGFLSLVCRSQSFSEYLRSVETGTTIPHISKAQIGGFHLRLPPPEEQRRIAWMLRAFDELPTLLNGYVETLEHLVEQLFRRAMSADPASGWSEITLGELGTVRGGGTPSTKVEANWNPAEVVWVTPKDMTGLRAPVVTRSERQISSTGLAASSAKLLPQGTVLLTSRATIGMTAVARVPLSTNQGFITIEPDAGYSSEFVLFALRSRMEEIHNRANGSTFMEINKTNFKAISLRVPPRAVREEFESTAKALFNRLSLAVAQIETVTALRNALLPKLISGEIRVPDTKDVREAIAAASAALPAVEGSTTPTEVEAAA